jgi:hypothetical protein
VLLLAAAALEVSAADPIDLATALSQSRVTPPARVLFREERRNPLFEEALVLEGYLEYPEAGVLNKVIQSPFPESFGIEHGSLRIDRDGDVREVSVDRSATLANIVGAIEAILAADSAQLESLFDIVASGTSSDWSLMLTPKERRARRQLSAIVVTAENSAVTRIRFEFDDDEWQDMHILSGVPAR